LIGVTLSYTIIVIAVVAVVIWAVTGGSSAPSVASSAPYSTSGVVVDVIGADVIGTNRPTA
jgi:hypothetical protein